jgi:hypothetical protein
MFCRSHAAATWPKVLPSLRASTVCFWLLRRRLGTASEPERSSVELSATPHRKTAVALCGEECSLKTPGMVRIASRHADDKDRA